MSLDKTPMAESARSSRKGVKERMCGVSVKLENSPDGRYGQAEKRNPVGSAGKKQWPFRGESEKDSGFSDTSSEYLSTLEQTDLEDQSARKKPAPLNPVETSTAAQSSLPSLTPVYIVKNVLLKEPLSAPTRRQLVHAQLQTWGAKHALSAPPGQTRVVFIRQPLSASLRPPKTETKAGAGKDTYLPILNSYPRIAPHPDRSRDDSGQGQLGHRVAQDDRTADRAKSKRPCVDQTGTPSPEMSPSQNDQNVSPVANWRENSRQPSWCGAARIVSQFDVSVSPPPVLSPNLVSRSESSESLCSWSSSSSSSSSFSPASPRVLSAQSPAGDGARPASRQPTPSPAKQRRFRNTVEILSRSGLLEITLKTKDLIRRNSGAQRQIDELKEHARLFCSAVRNGDLRALLRLQEVMKCSGSYGPRRGGFSSSSSSSTPSPRSATNQTLQASSEQA